VTPESLVRTVEDFLTSAGDAVIIEDGAVVFDLAQSKYSTSGERNKCLSHLWSEERNFVRRVLEAEVKNEILRLAVQRRGQAKPTKLEICRERDRRTVERPPRSSPRAWQCSSWWLRLRMCIPQRTRCCITFHRRSIGRCSALTRDGARGYGWCSGSGRRERCK
jgi:hypothetical protein